MKMMEHRAPSFSSNLVEEPCMMMLTSPTKSTSPIKPATYSFSSGSYANTSYADTYLQRSSSYARKEVKWQRAPVAIPDQFKIRDKYCVGGKRIPFTRFNMMAARNKKPLDDLDTIYESCYFLDFQYDAIMAEPAHEERVALYPLRALAMTFIQ
ncbi:hypothetical protein SPRG_06583 [Saprolegnia parasitica CBS 223.65]|uniref:Uncharacterized protein n=1 Tax=Saprolegnia parasitica (strain CBS 223.65) TaxID=695850 RepID=A0A067CC59_SAPPC|nr:hypothetical protein SPRG_06583 [Saprolegnia parasitica CBS 223.65]KDO28344.1 hypothetical protein SPRG_06583 [Saprolegnia parasitica CBS 223.65]|eukprot:XP_012200792.1 hypothetical protein SPRG_06583 [Saprolegnia parasitica CBS 223.65]